MERLRNFPHKVGLKQSEKAIKQGKAKLVYLATDADGWLKEALEKACAENKVPIQMVPSRKELSKVCRVEVPAACAVLLCESTETR